MPTKSQSTGGTEAQPLPAKPPSKSTLVLKLLGRSKGATIGELQEPTGWQPHSTRAFLSNLRKKGMTVAREPRKTGEPAYRVVAASEAMAASTAEETVAAEREAKVQADAGPPQDGTHDAGNEVTAASIAASTSKAFA